MTAPAFVDGFAAARVAHREFAGQRHLGLPRAARHRQPVDAVRGTISGSRMR